MEIAENRGRDGNAGLTSSLRGDGAGELGRPGPLGGMKSSKVDVRIDTVILSPDSKLTGLMSLSSDFSVDDAFEES